MSTPTRRKFLIGVGAATTTSVAGCTGESGSEELPTTEDGDIEVRFWHAMGGAHGEAVTRLVDEFNSIDNGITVREEFQGGYREAFNAALSAAESGNAPEILNVNEVATGGVMGSGEFEPIENNLPDEFSRDNYEPFMMDYYTLEDALQAVPFNVAGGVLYYNRDALGEVGASEPRKDTRFSDITDLANQFVDGGFSDYGATWPNASYFVENWFALQDQVLVNNGNGRADDPTEIMLDTDAGYKVFEWWSQMDDDGLYETQGIEAWGSATQSFINENVGIMMGSTSALGALQQDADFEIGSAYMPMPDDIDRTGLTVGGGALWTRRGLSDESELSAATGEFIHWLLQAEQGAQWHRDTGYQPPHSEARDVLSSEGFFDENPVFRTIFDQFEETESTIATQGAVMGPFLEVRTRISEGYNDISQGTPVDEGVDTMKSGIDEVLQRHAGE